jgi:hypothetical protein
VTRPSGPAEYLSTDERGKLAFHLDAKPSRVEDQSDASLTRIHKLHQTIATENWSSRTGFVLKSRDHTKLLSSSISPAQRNLILSRSFVLKLGREPSVNRPRLATAALAQFANDHLAINDNLIDQSAMNDNYYPIGQYYTASSIMFHV